MPYSPAFVEPGLPEELSRRNKEGILQRAENNNGQCVIASPSTTCARPFSHGLRESGYICRLSNMKWFIYIYSPLIFFT